jgi:hypothetical protein
MAKYTERIINTTAHGPVTITIAIANVDHTPDLAVSTVTVVETRPATAEPRQGLELVLAHILPNRILDHVPYLTILL